VNFITMSIDGILIVNRTKFIYKLLKRSENSFISFHSFSKSYNVFLLNAIFVFNCTEDKEIIWVLVMFKFHFKKLLWINSNVTVYSGILFIPSMIVFVSFTSDCTCFLSHTILISFRSLDVWTHDQKDVQCFNFLHYNMNNVESHSIFVCKGNRLIVIFYVIF
jgi:hypothetical protein